MESASSLGPRDYPTVGDDAILTSKPLIRTLTTATISTSSYRSDIDSLWGESDVNVHLDLCTDCGSLEHTTCEEAASCTAPNPLATVLQSVAINVTKWKEIVAKQQKEQELHLLLQVKKVAEFAHSPEGISLRRKRLERYGTMGVALFSPIEGAFSESRDEFDSEHVSEKTVIGVGRSEAPDDNDDDHDDDDIRLHLVPDDDAIPRLLSERIMIELLNAMPITLRGRSWTRLFSITRDGDSFGMFLKSVERHAHTVVVIQTTRGEIVGGFADSTWDCRGIEGHFFGAGTSFLFSLGRSPDHLDTVQIYRWQGINDYSQICRYGCIGMGGGGGSFGLFLQDDFTRGSSGACDTYANPGPLTSTPCFDILNFEVYGFSELHWY